MFRKTTINRFIEVVTFFLVFLLFWYRGNISLDPDFGWHLKMGQIILTSGIPKTDPFSYTMSSFPFVDHEWLTNIGLYWLKMNVGKLGISAIFAFLVTILLRFNLSLKKIKDLKGWEYFGRQYYPLVLLILSVGTLLPFSGIRPQVLSWILLSILIKFITNLPKGQKWFYFIPFYFLFWANLHGSFAIGILTLFLVISIRSLSLKKIIVHEWVILFLSLGATFLNPYGNRLWGEVWMQISDTSLRWRILEWMPAVFFPNFSYLILVVISGVLVYGFRKKLKPEEFVLYSFFLLQGFLSVRHIPLWLMVSLPLLTNRLKVFVLNINKVKYGLRRFGQMTAIFLVISVIFLLMQIFLTNPKALAEKTFYPQKAVNYLKENLPEKEIFSEYGWGGYLIWHLPQKKVFIDGRMPSWRWEAKLSKESQNAMKEYEDLLTGKIPYQEVFQKYEIKTVLWPQPAKSNLFEKWKKDLNTYVTKLFHLQQAEDDFDFVTRLAKDGWQKVYEDPVSIIYEAPKEN